LDKESQTLALICTEVEVLLAFESRERLVQWQVHLRNHLPEIEQFLVQVTHTPGKSRITSGPARLHLQNKSFSLVTGLPPKVVGHWNIQHLRKYGLVDGRFCFEGGSLCGKGEGLYVLHTNEVVELSVAFESAAAGKLTLNRRPSKKRTVDGPCSCWLSNQVNCLHTCGSDSRRNAFTTGSDGSSCDAFSEILRISDRTDLIDDDSTSTRSTCCNQLRWSSSSTSENGTVYVSCSSLDGDGVEPSPSCGFLQNYDVPRNASMREFGRFMNDTSSLLSMSLRETTAISDNDGHYSSLDIPSFQLPKDFDDCTSSKLPSSSSTCSSSESGPSLFTTSPSLAEVDINNVVERYSHDGINHYAIPRKGNGHIKQCCPSTATQTSHSAISHNLLSNSGEFYDIPRNAKANL